MNKARDKMTEFKQLGVSSGNSGALARALISAGSGSGADKAFQALGMLMAVPVFLLLSSCESFDFSARTGGAITEPAPLVTDKAAAAKATTKSSAKKSKVAKKAAKKAAKSAATQTKKARVVDPRKRAAAIAASMRREEAKCQRAGAGADQYRWTLRIAVYDDMASAQHLYSTLDTLGFPVYLRESGSTVGLYTGRAVSCGDALQAKRILDPPHSLDTVVERYR